MIVSTFSMPSSGSAPTRAGAVLVPFADRMRVEWVDGPDETVVRVTHSAAEADALVARMSRAHPKVRLQRQDPVV